MDPTTSAPAAITGYARWMSPELFDPERFGFRDDRRRKESDCYALGMVILEVLSGQVPFMLCPNSVVALRVAEGKRPGRPKEAWFTDEVWDILERCWAPDTQDRPRIEDVFHCLEEASPSWTTFHHLVSSTVNSSDGELSGRGSVLTTDVS